MLQLVRLEGALRLGAEAVAAGDIGAIGPYLNVLDRIDRYRRGAAPLQVYDKASRARLFAKLNQIAAGLLAETEPKPPAAEGASDGAAAPKTSEPRPWIRPQALEKTVFAEAKNLDFASAGFDFPSLRIWIFLPFAFGIVSSRTLAAILR